jgi:hypothetical protein
MRSTRPIRLLIGALAAAAASIAIASSADARHPDPSVPGEIAVEAGNTPFLTGHALGVQMYSCKATAGGFDWAFIAPRANLFDGHGRIVVTHFAGPTWQAIDGSAVKGAVDATVTPDRTAIPWLRLVATPVSDGHDGGRLARTSFIQRTNTVGGVAPADADCSAATAGTVVEVPYTADYVFWRPTRH